MTRNVIIIIFVNIFKVKTNYYYYILFFNSHLEEIKKSWLCIPKKVKEVNFKILHQIYLVNSIKSKYVDIGNFLFLWTC